MELKYFSHVNDKLMFIRSCIIEVGEHIRTRQAHKEHFLSEIEGKVRECRASIFRLDFQNDFVSQRRTNLEIELSNFEREKRQQILQCWSDVTALEKELRELRKQYQATVATLCSVQTKLSED